MIDDPVNCVIDAVMNAMREAFAPDSPFPPVGGGTTDVRLFAGDGAPFAAWNAHSESAGCEEPFLWTRVVRRYRVGPVFPAPYIGDAPCGAPQAVAIECGVARCAVVDAQPSWDDYASEAEVSLDDSFRLDLVTCRAERMMRSDACAVSIGVDPITPFGPEGGIVAWVVTLYVQLA